tara:strand:+ start:1062 stop:1865 length:804 start_codon:yes stop_codon:yes gene_type:complete
MILPTRQTEKAIKTMGLMHKRAIEGQKLVALESATLVLRFIRGVAPVIDGDDYSKRLKPVFSVEKDGNVNVSIIGEGLTRRSSPADSTAIAYLYPKGMMNPAYQKAYEVLRDYQPWPLDLYPLSTESDSPIGLATRRVSKGQYRIETDRIMRNKRSVELGLKSAGFNLTIEASKDSLFIKTDLAFAILQTEYGIGRKLDSHWRPALMQFKRELGVLQDKYKLYLMNGRASIFDVDNSVQEVSNIKDLDNQLQKKLSRSSGLKLEPLK